MNFTSKASALVRIFRTVPIFFMAFGWQRGLGRLCCQIEAVTLNEIADAYVYLTYIADIL